MAQLAPVSWMILAFAVSYAVRPFRDAVLSDFITKHRCGLSDGKIVHAGMTFIRSRITVKYGDRKGRFRWKLPNLERISSEESLQRKPTEFAWRGL
jgi:hypothetical protein